MDDIVIDVIVGAAMDLGISVKEVTRDEMSVIVRHISADACYNHVTDEIFILDEIVRGDDQDKAAYVLAHEIGHALDRRKNERWYMVYPKIITLLKNYDDAGVPKSSVPDVLFETLITFEQNAYDEADKFLDLIGVGIDPKKRKCYKDASLRSYRKVFRGC